MVEVLDKGGIMSIYVKLIGYNRHRCIKRDPHLWTKIRKFLGFWISYGEQFYMHKCNFTHVSKNVYKLEE